MLQVSADFDLERLGGMETAKRAATSLAKLDQVRSVLFYGSCGIGKIELAKWLSAAWMCPDSDGFPCGSCQVCKGVHREDWVDLLFIRPVGPSSIIRRSAVAAPDVRRDDDPPIAIRDFLATYPIKARQKVVIINECDRMNGDAANALLKTLEEPLKHARIILVAESIGSVLPTILSRCVCIACSKPRSVPDGSAVELFSEGAARIKAEMLTKSEFYAEIETSFRQIAEQQPGASLRASELLRGVGDRLTAKLGYPARQANSETLRYLALWLARYAPNQPESIQLVAEAHRQIVGNANPGIVFDNLCLGILASLRGRATRELAEPSYR